MYVRRCMFSDGSGEVVMFCDGDLVKTVLNLSQLDWCAFKEVAEKTGQLLYKRPSVFLVQEDKKQRDEVIWFMHTHMHAHTHTHTHTHTHAHTHTHTHTHTHISIGIMVLCPSRYSPPQPTPSRLPTS